jgi:hypothetical protein
MNRYQNYPNLRKIYSVAPAILDGDEHDVVLTVPNRRAIGLNKRFIGLSELSQLDFRAGIAMPKMRTQKSASFAAADMSQTRLAEILAPFILENAGGEIIWSPDQLASRLQPPNWKANSGPLVVHTGSNAAIVTSRNTHLGMGYTLVWAALSGQEEIDPGEVADLLRLASRYHGTFVYVYVGRNERLSVLPGRKLPEEFRPSPLILQGRGCRDRAVPDIRRYELIDFDFA